MASIIQPRVLKGFRDFLPETEIQRRGIVKILEEQFRLFGFVPIDTPILEYTEVLLGKGGGETDKQVYRFEDHGGRDVAMRFDLTVPFARFMAAHVNELYLPFKRYHMAKVFRGENTQRGRYREFMQCDFDIVGTDTASADFEILTMMHDSFHALGVSGVTIRLSHRGIFNRFLAHRGIAKDSAEILRTVDKLSKIGSDAVLELLEEISGRENARAILDFIGAEGDFSEVLEKMEGLAGGEDEDTRRLKDLKAAMARCGIQESFVLDPSITRGLDYYTGVVFETFLDELPQIGSVCSGGRYNNLASLYTKQELPGVGASIGLDRLMAALEQIGTSGRNEAPVEAMVLCMDEEGTGDFHAFARTLRSSGIRAEVYPDPRKLGAQFGFAEKKGALAAVLLGEEERKAGTVTVKDLAARKNHGGLSPEEAIKLVRELTKKERN
ncbi:histidine--tRNA ligase [Marispirochaeta aestuarii]|uniref:histidine--tRNA ligase n=1 Tax=Marispirochaeta aestuarii TaxID=1963862 RepID=UPI0029C76D4D|nr:histidine--tRNA ligase [Marispirochaeta aestuarii]